MSQIIINNRSYQGKNVTINKNVVYIDGKRVDTEDDKVINISIEGNVDTLEVDACQTVTVNGEVKSLTTISGDVKTNTVSNGINTTSGDITVNGNVNGSINTISGDVDCGNVSGGVSTLSGDIKKR